MQEQHQLLSEREAASLLGFRPRTLQNWRLQRKRGPDHVQVNGRIRYRLSDLDRWVAERLISEVSSPTKREENEAA